MQASEGSFLCIQASLLLALIILVFILPIWFVSSPTSDFLLASLPTWVCPFPSPCSSILVIFGVSFPVSLPLSFWLLTHHCLQVGPCIR